MPNAKANLPGPLQGLHAARNQNAAPVKLSGWFGGVRENLHHYAMGCAGTRPLLIGLGPCEHEQELMVIQNRLKYTRSHFELFRRPVFE
jgi:hypothetical protein